MISKRNRKLLDKIRLAINHIDNGYPQFAKMFLNGAVDIIIDSETVLGDRKSKSSTNGRNRKISHLKKVI